MFTSFYMAILLITLVIAAIFIRALKVIKIVPVRLPLSTVEVFCKKHNLDKKLKMDLDSSLDSLRVYCIFIPIIKKVFVINSHKIKILSLKKGDNVLLNKLVGEVVQGELLFTVINRGPQKINLKASLVFNFRESSQRYVLTTLFDESAYSSSNYFDIIHLN